MSSCIGIYELSRAFFPRKQSNTGYLTYYQSLKRLVRTPFSKSRRTSAPKICQINVFSCILYIETQHYEYSSSRLWIVPTALTSNPTFVFVFFSLFEYNRGRFVSRRRCGASSRGRSMSRRVAVAFARPTHNLFEINSKNY